MLTKTQIIEYAIKGIDTDIETLEKSIRKGKSLLQAHEKGIATQSSKSAQETQDIVKAKQAELEKLIEVKHSLKWEIDVNK